MSIRGDKQARAALNNFNKWYQESTARGPHLWFECTMNTSALRAARRAAPHTMLYFLILVLQRLVHNFWETAHQNDYVKRCAAANGRCPPSIIAMLFYMECTDVSPHGVVAIPETKKLRIYDSQAARAGAQAAAASPSGAAAAVEDAAQVQAAHDAYWQTFAENVMEHLAGLVTFLRKLCSM